MDGSTRAGDGDPFARGRGGARERILDAAYELFSRYGIRAVGIDRIVAESGVAKMTLYRHFASKEELVIAFLQVREERWTRGWLEAGVERLAAATSQRALAVLDLFDEWFHRSDFEGCSFTNTLLEFHDADDAVRQAATRHLDVVRRLVSGYLEDTPLPDEQGYVMQTLMLGAIVSAGRGDVNAARRIRKLLALLLERDPQASPGT